MKPKSTPDPASLRERALAYLARREHSRFELARKLEAAGFSTEAIHPMLDGFEEKGWLSDRRFAESYVTDHCSRAGGLKLANDLRLRGIANDLIESVLHKIRDSENARASAARIKRFGSEHASTPEQKVKQMRFLQGRGFSPDIIKRVVCCATSE